MSARKDQLIDLAFGIIARAANASEDASFKKMCQEWNAIHHSDAKSDSDNVAPIVDTIAKLEPKEGDIITLRYSNKMPPQAVQHHTHQLKQSMEEIGIKGVLLVLLPNDCNLDTIDPDIFYPMAVGIIKENPERFNVAPDPETQKIVDQMKNAASEDEIVMEPKKESDE